MAEGRRWPSVMRNVRNLASDLPLTTNGPERQRLQAVKSVKPFA